MTTAPNPDAPTTSSHAHPQDPPPAAAERESTPLAVRLLPWAQVLSLVAIPIVVGIVGSRVSSTAANRAVDVRMVELGIVILESPISENSAPFRDWALDIIDHYSEVKVPQAMRRVLIDSIPLPLPRSVSALWSSSDTVVATVTPTGQVTAKELGTTQIMVCVGEVCTTSNITVGPPQ